MAALTPAVLTLIPGRFSLSEVLPQGGLVCNLNAQIFSNKLGTSVHSGAIATQVKIGTLNIASHTDDMGLQVKTGNINSGTRCS